ncbi:MAG TPA: uroporphyrinogen decarboxylase family protein [Anaerolineaceae bacterium]
MNASKPLTHRERLELTLAGQMPDRVPVALWRHFPVDDQTPGGLAAAVTAFQRQFDFDLIKVTPSSSFCLYDWGVQDRWAGNPEGTREYLTPIIQQPEDWARLTVLDPARGHLRGQIECLEHLAREFNPHTPLLQTIFSPLSQAKNLVGKANLAAHLRRYPDALHAGLEILTETTIRFLQACKPSGIAGIFYAVQHAQYGILSVDEYNTFGRPYDLRILEAAQDLWLNMLHLHGEQVMFAELADYPVQVINWHDRQTPPDLPIGQQIFPGVVCGGLRQWETMVLGTPEAVRQEAADALRATGGRRFILGTGCVLPTTAPYGNIVAARSIVDA